ncbi:Putative multidrug export ATP-binding/permease protein [Clostridiales bacterium CHKCI001]|nr:Putative multidrug export ATP-binding/permease protein [Clostridiales bacterium CHKCI001]
MEEFSSTLKSNYRKKDMSQFFQVKDQLFQDSYNRHADHPVKILLGIYRGNYGNLFLSTLFYVIKHSPVWILPIITANIVNYVTGDISNTWQLILQNAVVVIALVILNVPMNYLHTRFKSKSTRSVEAGLRSTLVRKIQQLSISYHKEMQSGRIQSKIMRDVEAVETLSSQMFVSLLNIAINIVVALGVTVFRSRIVFFFFLLTVPVAALTIVVFKAPMRRRNQEFRQEMESTSAQVMEMVEMIPVTRAHALEEKEAARMSEQLQTVAAQGYRLDIVQSTFGSVSWAAFQIFQVLCLVFTAMLALHGTIEAGDIVLYQSYFTTIVNQVSSVITLLPTISKGMESVRSIGEILNSDDIEDNQGKQSLPYLIGAYDFENIHFQYPKAQTPILNGVSFRVNPGETIALVGESGAGKSTLLNMIIGFLNPQQGRILVDGNDLSSINLPSYRRFLAVVPQSTVLFSGSIKDNITYGLSDVTPEQLNQAIEAANLKHLIDALPNGLDTPVGEHGDKLSGGQKQRISIARALIRNPRVILFDEATSALDSISEKLIQDALENLTKDRTTFIVAHRLSTIRNADKICVIQNGVCVEFGTWEELMEKHGAFYEFRKLQV